MPKQRSVCSACNAAIKPGDCAYYHQGSGIKICVQCMRKITEARELSAAKALLSEAKLLLFAKKAGNE